MKGYLFVCEKHQISKNYVDDIKGILSQFNGVGQVRAKKVGETNLNIGFYTFTNEPKDIQYLYGAHQFGMSGDFLKEEASVFKGFMEAKSQNDYIANLGGIYTFASLFHDTFTAWNNVTRVEPIYWAENKERIVIGTKAILVHLIAKDSQVPSYEVSKMVGFLNNGFYADENTPYEGLNILELNRKIQVKENQLSIEPIDDFEQKLYTLEPTSETYDELTEAYLDSFSYLRRMDVELSTGLTGGKDSRMIAAALQHLGIDFKGHTTGYESTPDVIIAQQVASMLKIPHEFNPPGAGKDIIATDLYTRTANTIKNTEGLLYSYENVSKQSSEFDSNKMIFGGQGGENLRGGYARSHQIHERENTERFMLNAFIKYNDFFDTELIDDYQVFLKDFIYNKSKHIKPNDILNYFFLMYRSGRWAASSRPLYTSLSYAYSPLFENQLVKKAQLIQTHYGSNDAILYNILQRIEPRLIDIPFAEDRWNFEKKHPYHKHTMKNWISRQPVQATTKLSGFNWRKNILGTSKNQFSDIIFANENSPLFDIVNKDKLKQLFTSPPKSTARYDAFLWSLYTASILLSNDWFNGQSQKKSRISIKKPRTTTQKIDGVIEKIVHIPNDNLKANHKDLVVKNKDEVTSYINWNNFDDKWMYFQLFDGAFTIPPTERFMEISRVKGNHAELHFEIEKVLPSDFELSVYFIQYDSKERIASSQQVLYINENKKMYSYTVPLKSLTKQFKIAFKISKTNKQGSFMLNQMRIEYTT